MFIELWSILVQILMRHISSVQPTANFQVQNNKLIFTYHIWKSVDLLATDFQLLYVNHFTTIQWSKGTPIKAANNVRLVLWLLNKNMYFKTCLKRPIFPSLLSDLKQIWLYTIKHLVVRTFSEVLKIKCGLLKCYSRKLIEICLTVNDLHSSFLYFVQSCLC